MKKTWNLMAAMVLAMPLALTAADAGGPLPDVETVLKQVTQRAAREGENDRLFADRYTYEESKVTEYRNGKGQLLKRDEQKRSRNSAITTAALTTSDGVSKDGTANPSKVRGQAFQKKDFLLSGDLLKRFSFSVAGRDTIAGRPMVMIDFVPLKTDLPERNLKDRFINKASGRVWVDEADGALAKADLHLTQPVSVLGGLVGSVWKFNYGFERSRTADGIWYTRTVDWHLEGREVVVNRVVDYHEQKTEVRRPL
jgi:hypothetical protein